MDPSIKDEICPWHLFTALLGAFWIISAFFDNFVVTAILCVLCGLIAGSKQVHGLCRRRFMVE